MGFSTEVKEEILVKSARHCCVCHKKAGLKIEIHHITPKSEGGKDNVENAIPLCFECHADAGHYNDKHPKGIKYKRSELIKHRDEWFEIVKNSSLDSLEKKQEINVLMTEFKNMVMQEVEKISREYEIIIKNKYVDEDYPESYLVDQDYIYYTHLYPKKLEDAFFCINKKPPKRKESYDSEIGQYYSYLNLREVIDLFLGLDAKEFYLAAEKYVSDINDNANYFEKDFKDCLLKFKKMEKYSEIVV